ncbi:ABC transporter substrate-binding protein [Pelagibius marinus]|uniref:ABC transporter substrate-binding protein n=1 Tax=Pelagibius marinus TaxID=2762760 RepID=UPI0018728D8C|nr:ABC transporter substrate-binding protein [Pelagibius marinus]
MKPFVKFGSAVLLASVLAVPAAQAGETLDRVMSSKTLTMSSDPEYPPQSFLNDNNEMDGFDVDVGKEIAKRMGVELKIVTPSWDIITGGNWGGRWDMSVGSMTPTAKRAEVLNFPAVYYYTPAAFAVHKDSGISSLDDLNGKTIGSCGGCTYDAYLNKDLEIDAEGAPAFTYDVAAGEIKTYETDTHAFDDLRLGDGTRLDAVFSALPTIQEAIKNGGYPMKVIGKPAFYEPLSVATDKGDPDFDAKIAEIVAEMRADGTLKKLSEKWYGVDLTTVQ